MNFIDGTVTAVNGTAASIQVPGAGALQLDVEGLAAGDKVTVGIRPEAISATPTGVPELALSVIPHTVERLGLHVIVYAQFSGAALTCLFGGDPSLPEGEALTVHIPLSDIHAFDAAGNARTASR